MLNISISLAPIVLFVYNRPEHTRKTLEALQKNELSELSTLYVYSDGAKSSGDVEKVASVREHARNIGGFQSVEVIIRKNNWGLADNIVNGVTEIINEYDRVIVLEDDIITSPFFLRFMNEALEFYKNNKDVWHISGWNYPIDPEGLKDTFLWRAMNCWGWATWADRWHNYKRDPESLLKEFSDHEIKRFNLDGGYDFWDQVQANADRRMKTWAVFWYAAIFKNNGLCLNPTQSLVENVGHDGSGTNCGKTRNTDNLWQIDPGLGFTFPTSLVEDMDVVKKIKQKVQRKSLIRRVKKFLCRLI